MDQTDNTHAIYLNDRELQIVRLILDVTGHRPQGDGNPDLSMIGLPEGVDALTPRERQVLLMMLDGLTSAQIGVRIGVATRTVEAHRMHINEKLGVRRAIDLFSLFASERSRAALNMITGPRVPRGRR